MKITQLKMYFYFVIVVQRVWKKIDLHVQFWGKGCRGEQRVTFRVHLHLVREVACDTSSGPWLGNRTVLGHRIGCGRLFSASLLFLNRLTFYGDYQKCMNSAHKMSTDILRKSNSLQSLAVIFLAFTPFCFIDILYRSLYHFR